MFSSKAFRKLSVTLSSHRRDEGFFNGKIYPDNTCTIGYAPKKEISTDDRVHEREWESQYDSYERTKLEYGKTVRVEERFFDRGVIPNRLVKGSQSSQNPKTYGKNGITAYGKKVVSNGALLLQRKYGKRRLGFATSTIPDCGKEATRFLLQHWGDITRQFFQAVKRVVERRGNQFEYVSCTEIQEKRFARTKLACPHLHWVYISRSSVRGEWYVSANEYRSIWKRIILNHLRKGGFSPVSMEINFKASVDCQTVKKSASGYLGKYLSKGCGIVKRMQEEGYEEFPRQWWSASKSVKAMFKDAIVHLSSSAATEIFYRLHEFISTGLLSDGAYAYATINGQERAIGCSVKVVPKYRGIFDTM